MKKSSIFKILTLFLTIIIFSCCSGCIFALADYFNEKELQEVLEIERQRKEQADALIPEIAGYTFEAIPYSRFEGSKDWVSQGFHKGISFFDPLKIREYYLKITALEDGSKKITVKRENYLDDWQNYVIMSPEQVQKYGELFPVFSGASYFIYNGESFIAPSMETVALSEWMEGSGATALFLVNFEKHEMYYVGYSKGWIEAELEDNKLYDFSDICFRLTKKEVETI